MHFSEKIGRCAAELFLFREGKIMTQRRLLIGCAVAAAIAFAGIQRSALAQNNADKDSKAASSDSSSNNSQANNNQNDSKQDQNGNSSAQNNKDQNDKDTSPGSTNSYSNQGNQETSNNNSQSNSSQSSEKQATANSNTQAPAEANRSTDRSTSNNDNRDSQADRNKSNSNRSSADRGSDNRSADSRNTDSRRDIRNDFKFGRSTDRGLAIATLVTDSIFYRSGLRNGDVIVSYNGQRIRNQDDFGRYLVYEPGQRVPVVVYRNGREETIYVTYEGNNAESTPAGGSSLLGADFDPQSNNGAVIIRVQKGGPADRAGLRDNDLVVALNGEQVQDGRHAIELVNRMQSGERVEVEYMRHARAQVTLGGGGAVSDTRFYRGDDKDTNETTVAVGVNTDRTRRDNSARDRDNNDRNRRDDGRDRSRLLPRLRN
jgi:C-terminal processing protease CtpA/Prc